MNVRRCDALCHQARRKTCTCWCGGRYHGKGPVEAARLFEEDFGHTIDGPDFAAVISEGLDFESVTADEIELQPDYRKVLR